MKQREIKFRAWDGVNNVMKEWEYIAIQFDITDLFGNERFTPMQFTGLTDKNGVEIYEGDIVTADLKQPRLMNWPCKGFIQFLNGEFVINTGKQLLDDDNDYYAHFWAHDNIEVIGNIYEHPELLTIKNS